MILTVIGLLIGCMICGAGIYYLMKEKNDLESKKIYSITTGVGAVIVLAALIRFFVF
ncbi:MAG: hypothetical protein Q4E24_14505 [bacterium]|nr:hypothetical protein [bacterium]